MARGARAGGGGSSSTVRQLALVFVVGGVLFVLVAVAVVLILTRTEERPVPAVVGGELTQAQAALDKQGFDIEVRRTANVAAKDLVLGQSPDAGAAADEGSTVRLTVSAGPGQGTIPDVGQLGEPRAQAVLRAAGFATATRREFSKGAAAGKAIRTRPAAGARVRRGSQVTLVVSKGPQTVAAPDLVGDAEATARRRVEQAGLRIETTPQRSNQKPGTVLSQAPRPGSVLVRGSAVEVVVVVDKAPRPVQVPNVQGKPVRTAVATLSDLGLAVFFRTKAVGGQADKVLGQEPAPGAKARPGSRVVLEVAGGEPAPARPAPAGPGTAPP